MTNDEGTPKEDITAHLVPKTSVRLSGQIRSAFKTPKLPPNYDLRYFIRFVHQDTLVFQFLETLLPLNFSGGARLKRSQIPILTSLCTQAVYCCVLLCTALYCCVLLCTALYCCVLRCTAVYCAVLHLTAVYYTLYCCVLS